MYHRATIVVEQNPTVTQNVLIIDTEEWDFSGFPSDVEQSQYPN